MYRKLNKTLINDKKVNTTELSKLLKFEFNKILCEYGEAITENSLTFDIDERGNYILSYSATLKRIKSFGVLQ